MARRKNEEPQVDFPPAEPAAAAPNPTTTATADSPAAPPVMADGAAPKPENTWVEQLGSWSDQDAGVRLVEDRPNRRMTIRFDEKPSEKVRGLMKGEDFGFRFDGEDELWYKKINPAKPRQVRSQAEQLAFEVSKLIREEKGLPQKKGFSLVGM